MKKDNKMIAILLIGGGAFWYLTQSTHLRNAPRELPPRPPKDNTIEWQSWVALAISLFGTAKELWEPGGPFYGLNKDDILGDINPNDTSGIV